MHTDNHWQKAFIRVVTSPLFEVVAVVAVVSVALFAVLNTDAIYHSPHVPMLFGPR
jgi:hypothetical protein